MDYRKDLALGVGLGLGLGGVAVGTGAYAGYKAYQGVKGVVQSAPVAQAVKTAGQVAQTTGQAVKTAGQAVQTTYNVAKSMPWWAWAIL